MWALEENKGSEILKKLFLYLKETNLKISNFLDILKEIKLWMETLML